MNRISQEGADHINNMLNAIVDSIDDKLNNIKAPVAEVKSGKKAKKSAAPAPAVSSAIIADELNGLIELCHQIEREWEKV